ncbi:MAG: hypothetical protein LCH38_10825 [Proteobacteria bacterium]|nr:hypothetical protein [Pseudomonadota bacterium]
MPANRKMTESVALLGAIDADAYNASVQTTAWIQADDFSAYAALVAPGDMTTSATIDAKIEQATDGAGTGVKDLPGKAITQFTKVGNDDNKQAWINFKPSDLDLANGFGWVRLSMTIATAACDAAGYLFGFGAKASPASDYDATSVDEIVG